MNTMEITKIGGAACGALLVFMLAGWFSETILHVKPTPQQAFAVEIEEEEATDEVAEEVDMIALVASASADDGAKVFRKCGSCHKVEDGANGVGPHLWGVMGRQIGGVGGYAYSGDLANHGGAWTVAEMSAFLESPKGWAPGTKMSFSGLKDPEDRAAVIVYLNEADGSPEALTE